MCSSASQCWCFHPKAGREALRSSEKIREAQRSSQVPPWHTRSTEHSASSQDEGSQPRCHISSLSTDIAIEDPPQSILAGGHCHIPLNPAHEWEARSMKSHNNNCDQWCAVAVPCLEHNGSENQTL